MRTFKAWVKKFRGEDSPLGDLADDIAADKKFPYSTSYHSMRSHLKTSGACFEALQTFDEAYRRYWSDMLIEEMGSDGEVA